MRAWKWIILLGLACFCFGCSFSMSEEPSYTDPDAQKIQAVGDTTGKILDGASAVIFTSRH